MNDPETILMLSECLALFVLVHLSCAKAQAKMAARIASQDKPDGKPPGKANDARVEPNSSQQIFIEASDDGKPSRNASGSAPTDSVAEEKGKAYLWMDGNSD